MSSSRTGPESLVSGGGAAPITRDSPGGGDSPFVLFELNVVTPPYQSGWYAVERFPFTRLPELPGMILDYVPIDVLSLISNDWHELQRVLGLLRDLVTAYIYESMEGMLPLPGDARPMYWIRAVIRVVEPSAPAAPVASMLRTVTYESNKEEATEDEAEMVGETLCPICLEDFEDGEEVHLTPCGHPFHLPCLERSLQSKWKCPLCRADMPR